MPTPVLFQRPPAQRQSLARWFFEGLYDYRLVLSQLIWQQLTLRYRRTALGFLWTLINPLLTMTVSAVMFSMIMKWPLKSFAIFLFSGLVPFGFFSGVITQGSGILLASEGLIKKIYIPRQIFVAAIATSLLVDTLFNTASLFLIALGIGAPLTPALLTLPISFFLLFMFVVGVTLALSVATVFFRDLPNIVGVVLQAVYYLTPILYPITYVPERFRALFMLNPLYYFVELFRLPIYQGDFPGLGLYLTCGVIAICSLLLGMYVFRMADRHIVFRL